MLLRRLRVVIPVLVVSLLMSACAAGESGDDDAGGTGEAKGSITVTSLWGGVEQEAFQKMLDAFKAKTGITATYESQRTDYATVLRTRISGGNAPDVAIMPGIGFLRSFVADGQIKALKDLGMDRAATEAAFAPGSLSPAVINNELYGVMMKLSSKSVVWYKPDSFKEEGFEVPTTYEDMVKVTDEYRAKGKTPWAVGAKDSWTLTDWFENIYLLQAGSDKYDQLFSGKIAFTDPSVTQAIETMKQIVNDKNIPGGIDGALGVGFVDGIGQVFGTNPKAEMYFEGGFVGGIATGQVNKNLKIGTDIDFFDFPSIGGSPKGNIVIGGDMAAAFNTEPATAEFMKFLTTPEAGNVAAETGVFTSPLKGVDVNKYPNDLAKKEAEQVAGASVVKYDGADLLPAGQSDLFGAALQDAIKSSGAPDLAKFEQGVKDAWEQEANS
jgi:alpha-glucoside transport system substrate-binding protein